MKKLLILSVLFCLNIAFSQKIRFSELIALHGAERTSSDIFLSRDGFSFVERLDDKKSETFKYITGEKGTASYEVILLEKERGLNSKITVYVFYGRDKNINLMEQIGAQGFQLTNIETENQETKKNLQPK